jgi:ABC-2 type transport system ATP-binding protein
LQLSCINKEIFMIQLQNVSKSFKGNIAIKNLNLDVKKGEILGLLGANGAGKSTTINMLLGFLNPDSGSVHINDIDTCSSTQDTRKYIGYIPENVNLYPYLSGLENLDYFCKLAGLKYSKSKLENYLTTCGLQSEAHPKKVNGYSKGMRQKVGIAIAYAKKAKVYLLDEPASGLDPLASNELSILLKKLASEGATILMASHDIFRVRDVCNRIGILKNGVLVKELYSKDVSANELETLYLQFMQN